MADRYWKGGDGTFPNDWNTAANWSPAAVPSAGEDVYIVGNSDGSTQYPIDGYDASATALGNVYIDETYTKNIGDYNSGSPSYLKLAFGSGKKLTVKGKTAAQQIWIEVAGSNSADFFVNSFGTIADTAYASQGIHLKETGTGSINHLVVSAGTLSFEGGGLTTADIDGGTVIINSTSSFGTLRTSAGSNSPTIYIEEGGGIPTTMTFGGGTMFVNDTGASTGTITQNGGTIYWNGGADIGTMLRVKSGVFDVSGAVNRGTFADIEVYSNGTLNLDNGVGGCSLTNDLITWGAAQVQYPAGGVQSLAA